MAHTEIAQAAELTPADYRSYAVHTADLAGLNSGEFVGTLNCESHFNPEAIGDHDESLGIAQIHLIDHPDVSRETALDGIQSINWAAKHFAYEPRIWTCFRKLYGNNSP